MKNEVLQNIYSLLATILTAEKKEQEKYYSAVNSDTGASKRLMAEANARVKKLREVIDKLKDFHFEVIKILEDEAPPAQADSDEDLIVNVCEALIVEKPFKFLSLECEYVKTDLAELQEPYVKLSNSMYVSTAGPADEICKDILAKCDVEEHAFGSYYRRA